MLIAFGAFAGYLFWTGQATAWPEGVAWSITGWGLVAYFIGTGLWTAVYSVATNRVPGHGGSNSRTAADATTPAGGNGRETD